MAAQDGSRRIAFASHVLADSRGLCEEGDTKAAQRQPIGSGQPGRPGADHEH
jgi:hypothetical protein